MRLITINNRRRSARQVTCDGPPAARADGRGWQVGERRRDTLSRSAVRSAVLRRPGTGAPRKSENRITRPWSGTWMRTGTGEGGGRAGPRHAASRSVDAVRGLCDCRTPHDVARVCGPVCRVRLGASCYIPLQLRAPPACVACAFRTASGLKGARVARRRPPVPSLPTAALRSSGEQA